MDLAPFPVVDFSKRQVFIDYLLFYYALIVASGPLLEAAIAEIEDGPVREYYRKHWAEEKDHADWLGDDLASVEIAPKLNWHAARLAGTQYYLIEHVSPISLLGYMWALESRPMALEHVDRLEVKYGKALCRTLRFHAIHDVDHREDINEIIDILTANQQRLVIENAKQTALSLTEGF
jgi:hypothetical protein